MSAENERDIVLPREHKIYIFDPTCNVLFVIWRPDVLDIADILFRCFRKIVQVLLITVCRLPSQKIQIIRVKDIEALT